MVPTSLHQDPESVVVVATHAIRRTRGGARKSLHERVRLRDGVRELGGWSLNVSRGGLRIIVEDNLSVGEQFDLVVGEPGNDGGMMRRGRVVWIQVERDGTIAGIEFTGHGSVAA